MQPRRPTRRDERYPLTDDNDDGTKPPPSRFSLFPVFTWEEEEVLEVSTLPVGPSTTDNHDHDTDAAMKAYSHSDTRIPGCEALLVDCGAVGNLTGLDFIERQSILAKKHGYETTWYKLPRPKQVSGVGDAAKSCEYQAAVPGMLEDGTLISYVAPVIGGKPSPVPPLRFGLHDGDQHVYGDEDRHHGDGSRRTRERDPVA